MKAGLFKIGCGLVVGLALTARQGHAQRPPQVAFTFDDLPAHGPLPKGMARPQVVASILQTLKQQNMPPVYGFVNGFRVAQYPYQIEILKAWHDAGQPLGNHTWSHPSLDASTPATYEADIARNEAVLRQVDPNGDWRWFRYPYIQEGNTDAKEQAVRGYLKQHGYKVAEVTIDFEDYLWNDAYARCLVKHAADETAKAAAVAKLHDTYLSFAATYIDYSRGLSHQLYGRDIPYVLLLHVGAFDAKMLPDLIGLYRQRGFSFVTLPQAEADPAYADDPGIGYPGGGLLMEVEATRRKLDTPDVVPPDKMLDAMCQ